jgi:chaperone modulatory protein CbpM
VFSGCALLRARAALRLVRDLEVSVAGAALVLDLLDEIETLRARLRRAGMR